MKRKRLGWDRSIQLAFLSMLLFHFASPLPTLAADDDWAIAPFTRPPNAAPIITPRPESVFDCPMRDTSVRWEAKHTFNPAAVVKDGKIVVLYRAEDDSGSGIGGYTSRLGMAVSEMTA